MFKRFSVVLLSLMFAFVLPFTAFGNSDKSELLEQSLKFRSEMGLNYDRGYVNDLIDKKRLPISNKYGVVLSPSEETDLNNRLLFQEKNTPRIAQYIKENLKDENFGAWYIDQKNGGKYKIGLKKINNIASHKDNLNKLLDSEAVEFYEVKYTEKELEELHNRIFSSIDELKKNSNISIDLIVTNVITEKVEIYVSPFNDNVVTALNAIYGGDMLDISESTGNHDDSRTATHDPLQGGIEIYSYDANSTCSTAFNATQGNAKYVVTAGHCGSVGNAFYQGSNSIGLMAKKYQGDETDAALIGTNVNLGYSSKVYTGSSYGGTLTSWQDSSDDVVGESVCVSGYKTGVSCGTIQSRSASGTVGGISYSNLRSASYTSEGGDSGGTVYYNGVLKGVHKGTLTNNNRVYTQVEWALKRLSGSTTSIDVYPILN